MPKNHLFASDKNHKPKSPKTTLGGEKRVDRESVEKEGEEKKGMIAFLVIKLATLEILNENICLTEEFYLVITFSKLQLDLHGLQLESPSLENHPRRPRGR